MSETIPVFASGSLRRRLQKDVRPPELHRRRDAPSQPVVDALSAVLVELKQLGDLGGSAEVFDQFGVARNECGFFHGPHLNTAFMFVSTPGLSTLRVAADNARMHQSLTNLYAMARQATGRKEISPSELADLMVESQQTVNNWSRRGVSFEGALKAEALWGVPALAILGEVDGIKPRWLDDQTPRKLLAHQMSDEPHKITPTIKWGDLMSASLPAEFDTQMPDDSMAPRIKAGQMMRFSTTIEARPGDAVLVCDSANIHCVRIYRKRRPDCFEAYAVNADYPVLDQAADGLRVLAVLTGVLGRWG